ncbi:MAG: hypothetical protein R1F52_01900 [Candidatus Nitrosoabyssus spongiisocia]|nr:MAG: hypothetical protein R1F52_01900 [Nitrosopumilaceae archaeon AB1(1)]
MKSKGWWIAMAVTVILTWAGAELPHTVQIESHRLNLNHIHYT